MGQSAYVKQLFNDSAYDQLEAILSTPDNKEFLKIDGWFKVKLNIQKQKD